METILLDRILNILEFLEVQQRLKNFLRMADNFRISAVILKANIENPQKAEVLTKDYIENFHAFKKEREGLFNIIHGNFTYLREGMILDSVTEDLIVYAEDLKNAVEKLN